MNALLIRRLAAFISLLLIISAYAGSARATVNIETMRKADKEEGLHSTLSFNLSYTEGNTNLTNLRTSLRSDYTAPDYSAFLSASLQRGEKNEERYINKGFAHMRGMKPVRKTITIEGFLQKEFNDFTLLKDRSLAGTGLRLQLLDRESYSGKGKSLKLYIGLGVMLEREVISSIPEEMSSITRSTNYLSCKWRLNDSVNMSGTAYYQPRVSKTDDYRVFFEGGMAFAITDRMAFTLSTGYAYNSEPPPGVKEYDLEIINGINIDF